KPAGIFDYRIHAGFLREFQSGNIARISKGMSQCNVALEFVIEIVRRIGHAAAEERRGSIENAVVGLSALIHGGGIDKWLEGRTHLALGLSRPVELGLLKIAPADHGFDVACSIVDCQQSALRSRILLKQHSGRMVRIERDDPYICEVSGSKNLLRRFML